MIRTLKKFKSRSRHITVNSDSVQEESSFLPSTHNGPRSNTNHLNLPEDPTLEPSDSQSLSIDASIFSASSDETLLYDRKDYLNLQHTYEENFTSYLPYIVREGNSWTTQLSTPNTSSNSTVFDDSIISKKIFNKGSKNYNYKREFALASELFKSGLLVFPTLRSLEIFRKLKKKANTGDHGYEHGTVPKHIIPLKYKSRGIGLPLFKVHSPSLSSLRKNCPFLIIYKYKETFTDITTEDEVFVFCKVYSKYLKVGVKKYTLCFTPNSSSSEEDFEVVMFDHQSNPYCDTIYKNTRIRWVGTSIANVIQGSRKIQLMILDDSKPSLMDDVDIDSTSASNIVPDLNNKLLDPSNFITNLFGPVNMLDLSKYYSSTIPPFGVCKDDQPNFLPKKICKVGKIELYEDITRDESQVPGPSNERDDLDSTLSVNLDSMVLLTMALALREQELKKNPGVSRRLSTVGGPSFMMAPNPFGQNF